MKKFQVLMMVVGLGFAVATTGCNQSTTSAQATPPVGGKVEKEKTGSGMQDKGGTGSEPAEKLIKKPVEKDPRIMGDGIGP